MQVRGQVFPARGLVIPALLSAATAILAGLMVLVSGMLVVVAAEELQTGDGSDPAMRREWHPEKGHSKEAYSAQQPHRANW